MCQNCDYQKLLENAGLDPTPNRLRVFEVIGNNEYPLSARDVFATVKRSRTINRVTVYRILELLVEKNLVDRLSTGGRAAHFGMAPNEHHAPHPHFFCTGCGQMDCLSPQALAISTENLSKNFPGKINRVEIRVDGVCKNCLRRETRPD